MVVSRERVAGDHHGVAGAVLFGLQHKIYAGAGDSLANPVGFVADDGEDIARRYYACCRGDDMSQQWLASNFVEHFRKLRLQPRALAGSKNGDGNAWAESIGTMVLLEPG